MVSFFVKVINHALFMLYVVPSFTLIKKTVLQKSVQDLSDVFNKSRIYSYKTNVETEFDRAR